MTSPPTHTPKPLLEWEFEFCHWLAHQHAPSASEQLAKLEEEAQKTLKPRDLHNLKQRVEYKEFMARLRKDITKKARRQYAKTLNRTLELHTKGVERLHKELDDTQFGEAEMALKLIPAFVGPALARTWPTKEEHTAGTSITIHLTANQEASMEIPEGEFEVLPAEALDDETLLDDT